MRFLSAAPGVGSLLVAALTAAGTPTTAGAEPKPAVSVPLPDDAAEGGTHLIWVGFDPTGRFLAAHYPGRFESFVTVWDAARWDPVLSASAALDPPVRGLAFPPGGFAYFGPPAGFLPSGSHLVYLPEHGARVLRGRPLGSVVGRIDVPAWNDKGLPPGLETWGLWAGPGAPDVRRVGVNHERDRAVIQSASAEKPVSFGRTVDLRLPARASALALSPDHARLAWAEDPPEFDQVVTVHVRDLGSGKEAALKTAGPANRMSRLAFSPDGKRLAAGGADGVVRVWDLGTGKEIARCLGPLFDVSSLAFSPDGAVLAYGTYDHRGAGNVWVVSAEDGTPVAAWAAGSRGVSCVAFDPKGEWLAVVGGERVIRVYRVKDLRPRR